MRMTIGWQSLTSGREIESYPLAEPLQVPPVDRKWDLLWSSEDARYGGMGTPKFNSNHWRVPGHMAVVFKSARQSP